MASLATVPNDVEEIDLPFVLGRMNFSQDIARATSNLLDPAKTYRPLEAHEVKIRDARPIRDRLDLDAEGFVLLDHISSVSHLRDPKQLEGVYHNEIGPLIKKTTGADVVIPYRAYCQVRLSQRARGENGDETTRPAGFVHADVTRKTFRQWVSWVQQAEGVTVPSYRRVALYNAWRAVSPPPQDFPLAVADGLSVKSGKYVVMDNVTGLEGEGPSVETRLALYDPDNKWYYFSNMRASELIVFKTYDSKFNDDQTVMHSSFNNTARYPDATPRESIEARFFAFWL
jgi:hypothetical protein